MKGLAHLFHRHTHAARADAGDIVLCHHRNRTDAQVRPAEHPHWIRIRDLTFTELRYLLQACDSPYGDNAHVSASERLLFRAHALLMRRIRKDVPAGRDRDPDPGVPSVATTGRPGTQVTPVGAVGGGEAKRAAGLAAAPRRGSRATS